MATREDALNHIRNNYNYSESNGLFKMEFELEGGRSQVIFVTSIEDLLLVSSPFALNIAADLAFRLAEETFFGIRKMGDAYVVQHVIPMSDLDASEIDFGFKSVAIQADRLESMLGGDSF